MQRDLLLVAEMIDAAEQAMSLVAGTTLVELERERQRRDALLWNFTVPGEAANLVSDATKARFPAITWRIPTRLRNRIVHAYWSIDLGILHATATQQLPGFVYELRSALTALRSDESAT